MRCGQLLAASEAPVDFAQAPFFFVIRLRSVLRNLMSHWNRGFH